MVEVTEQAKELLKQILAEALASVENPDPELSLRLAPQARGQLGLIIDKEREGDQVVEEEDSPLLLIEAQIADSLAGATIDCQDTPGGPQLVLASP